MSNSVTTQLEMFQNIVGSFIANAKSAGSPWKTGAAEFLHMEHSFFPLFSLCFPLTNLVWTVHNPPIFGYTRFATPKRIHLGCA